MDILYCSCGPPACASDRRVSTTDWAWKLSSPDVGSSACHKSDMQGRGAGRPWSAGSHGSHKTVMAVMAVQAAAAAAAAEHR